MRDCQRAFFFLRNAQSFFAARGQTIALRARIVYNIAMKYKEITINTTTEASELVADVLYSAGSNGVSIFDKEDFINLMKSDVIWDYVDESVLEKNEVVKVKGYFEEQGFDVVKKDIERELALLRERSGFPLGSLELSVADVDDEDWANVWRKYYKPILCGRVVIVPDWLSYEPQDDQRIVRLDPGMAFGTGEHESTRICLTLLQKEDVKGARVADIGTGSGILAIAAAKLDAKEVDAYDIDATAVKVAVKNCEHNGVDSVVKAECGNLLDKCSGSYDILLANITADILSGMAKDIGRFVRKGGVIIISGILLPYEEKVRKAFAEAGLVVKDRLEQGEWCGFAYTRN